MVGGQTLRSNSVAFSPDDPAFEGQGRWVLDEHKPGSAGRWYGKTWLYEIPAQPAGTVVEVRGNLSGVGGKVNSLKVVVTD